MDKIGIVTEDLVAAFDKTDDPFAEFSIVSFEDIEPTIQKILGQGAPLDVQQQTAFYQALHACFDRVGLDAESEDRINFLSRVADFADTGSPLYDWAVDDAVAIIHKTEGTAIYSGPKKERDLIPD